MPKRPRAASHGQVTRGKSLATKTTSPPVLDNNAASWPRPPLAPPTTATDDTGAPRSPAAAVRSPSRTLASAWSDRRRLPCWATSVKNRTLAATQVRGITPSEAWFR